VRTPAMPSIVKSPWFGSNVPTSLTGATGCGLSKVTPPSNDRTMKIALCAV